MPSSRGHSGQCSKTWFKKKKAFIKDNIFYLRKHPGAEAMAQLVKCLLYPREDLSWDLQEPHKKPGTVVCT